MISDFALAKYGILRWSIGMLFNHPTTRLILAGLISITGMAPVQAELPTLTDKEWLGYFVGFEDKNFQLGVTTVGKILLKVKGKNGDVLGHSLAVDIGIVIEETQTDGKVVQRKIIPESLESAQQATQKPDHVAFRGKVTGDTGFEATLTEGKAGEIILGGRLLDPETLKKPTRFSLVVKFPSAYEYAMKDSDKKTEKAFEDKIKKDRLQLILVDKKRAKLETAEPAGAELQQINGVGVTAAQLGLAAYQGKEFEITASENSRMTISSAGSGPLHDGFSLNWSADPAKDPQGHARLAIKAK